MTQPFIFLQQDQESFLCDFFPAIPFNPEADPSSDEQ